MNAPSLSRRRFLVVVPAAGTALLLACHHEVQCNDLSSLSADDIATRTRVHYDDHSVYPEKHCSNCLHFRPAGANACGGCANVRGPINPAGYCDSWASRAHPPDGGGAHT